MTEFRGHDSITILSIDYYYRNNTNENTMYLLCKLCMCGIINGFIVAEVARAPVHAAAPAPARVGPAPATANAPAHARGTAPDARAPGIDTVQGNNALCIN